jgi:transposase
MVEKLAADQAKLTALSTEVFWHLYEEFLALEKRLAYDDEKRATIGQAPPACQRRQTIPGIGPVSATALIAAIGEVPQCKNGRQLAAWRGLVLREHSTGGKPRLLARRGKNRAAVALANTNARIAWALLAHHEAYRVRTVV